MMGAAVSLQAPSATALMRAVSAEGNVSALAGPVTATAL